MTIALRLARVRENLAARRLRRDPDRGRPAQLPPSLGAASFDRVLVDAPCSATGVIRRHPDIKLLRRASDIESFAATQRADSRHRFRTTASRADVSSTALAR